MSPLTIQALEEMGNVTQDNWAKAYEKALERRTDKLYTIQAIRALPWYRKIWHLPQMASILNHLRYEQVFINECRDTIDWNRVHRSGSYRLCFQLEILEGKLIKSLHLSDLIPAHV